jgi:hypothetical protein
MIIIVALFITVAIFASASRVRVPHFSNDRDLGSMSKQWLAEYRAAHGL